MLKRQSAKSYSGGLPSGPHFFNITKVERGKTKAGDESVSFFFDIYDLEKKKIGDIKYFSVLVGQDFGQAIINNMMWATNMSEGEYEDFVGKGGLVLLSYKQNYRDQTKWYTEPAFGGTRCWFSKDKFSPKEIEDGAIENVEFANQLSKLLDTPYEDLDGNFTASKPKAQTSEEPETDEDMPY